MKPNKYHLSSKELQTLIHYLKKYFSFPERSVERSKIVQTVSKILNNSHWDHTTIRKWFNNNKYEYTNNIENIFYNKNKNDETNDL